MAIQDFDWDIRKKAAVKFEAAIDLSLLDELHGLSRLPSLIGHETILMP
jgi:hypothetical protein